MPSPSLVLAAIMSCVPMCVCAAEASIQSLYEITDLATDVQGFPPPVSLGIRRSRSAVAAEVEPGRMGVMSVGAILARFCDNRLMEEIRATTVIQHTDNDVFLIVTAAPSTQLLVTSALRRVRVKPRVQIAIRATLFLMDPNLRQERFAFPKFQWKTLGGNGHAVAMIDSTEQREQIALLEKESTISANAITVMEMPAVTAWSEQTVHFQVEHTLEYYRTIGYPPQAASREMSSLLTGDMFAMLCRRQEDDRVIDLHFQHHRCALIAFKDIDMGTSGHHKEPDLWFGHECIDLPIPDGGSVVIATGLYLDGSQPRAGFMVVTAKKIVP